MHIAASAEMRGIGPCRYIHLKWLLEFGLDSDFVHLCSLFFILYICFLEMLLCSSVDLGMNK